MSVAALNHTNWPECNTWSVLQTGKLFMTPSILSLLQLDMSYCTYWLGQGTGCFLSHWLPGHLSASSDWLPGGEWEGSSPHPPPVAERVNVKTLSLPIIWVTLGFGVCLRARVSACVCMLEGERDKEREKREGEANSISSPPHLPAPCHSILPPLCWTTLQPCFESDQDPYHPTTPGPFDSPHFCPTNHKLFGKVRPLLMQPLNSTHSLNHSSSLKIPLKLLPLFLFSLHCCLCSAASPSSLHAYFKFPLQQQKVTQLQELISVRSLLYPPPPSSSDILLINLSLHLYNTISPSSLLVSLLSLPLRVSTAANSVEHKSSVFDFTVNLPGAEVYKDNTLCFARKKCISNWFFFCLSVDVSWRWLFIDTDVPGTHALLGHFLKCQERERTTVHWLENTWHCTKCNDFTRHWLAWLNQVIFPEGELWY